MSRFFRTILIFTVKDWPTSNFHLFFSRYIDGFNRYIPRDKIRFEVTDFIGCTIAYVLDVKHFGQQEASERLDDTIDLFFVPDADDPSDQLRLDRGTRHRLLCYIEDMAEVIATDLLLSFERSQLRYHEDIDIGDVLLRNNAISFVVEDLSREVW